ncbi:MAG: flagellar hook-basal body complex protein FliE [Paraglaciecola sp.]|jgi:flagellar hook-basal body complex protein FliE
MDIKAQSLFQDMQSMALQSKTAIGEIPDFNLPGIQSNPSADNFADMLGHALESVNSMQLNAKEQSQAFEMGDKNLSLADVMVAKEKAGIGFEATIQVRNKLLDAYKTIMNMPV